MSDDANDTTALATDADVLERLKEIRAATQYGSVQINGKSATAVQYEKLDDEQIRLTYRMGRRTVAKVTIESDALRIAIGDENAERIRQGEAKGTLREDELRYHRGQGDEAPARAPRKPRSTARVDVDSGKEARESAEPTGTNAVEPDRSAARDAVARAAKQRAIERAEREGVATTSETRTRGAQEPAAAAAPASGTSADDPERRRRDALLEEVRTQFRVVGERYRFKDGAQALAFTDHGEKLATASNDARAARAVASLADAKGWQQIKVAGHGDFRREVWLEARARGLEVRGYTPTEQDRRELGERTAAREPNAAERVTTTPERMPDSPSLSLDKAASMPAQASGLGSDERAKPDRAALTGTLVEHGPAPYRHDPEERPSYRAKLANEAGEREVWGVDLERGIAESGARPGDTVELAHAGRKPVSVDATKRDEQGRVVGTERIDTVRNAWDVRVTERRQVLEAVQDAFADAHAPTAAGREALRAGLRRSLDERDRAGELPSVPVYDHRAPSQATQRARMHDTEQTTERFR